MRFALVILFVTAANAAQLFRASKPIPGRYIIKLKDGVAIQSVLPLVTSAGGRSGFQYDKVFNGFAAELSDKALDIVRKLRFVEYVEEDGVAHASAVASWGLDRIDNRLEGMDGQYNAKGTGQGVTVYVLDTGIHKSHNDFQGRVSNVGVECLGLVNPTCLTGTQYGEDGDGHGTHCAGTVSGLNYGVAKKVSVVAVKVLDDNGSGSWSGIIAGMDYVAKQGGKRVASMSLGGGYSSSVNEAVRGAHNAGVSVVVAAGNENADACNTSPASSPYAVTVGSSTSRDQRSSFSNYGTCLDIFAPGSSITSASHRTNSGSTTMSGTSMACPHVAGAIAVECAMLSSRKTCVDAESAVIGDATGPNVIANNLNSPQLLVYVGN